MNFERPVNGFRNAENGSLKTDMDLERSEIEAENGCRRPGLHLGVALEKPELNIERPWSGQKSILNSEAKKSSI